MTTVKVDVNGSITLGPDVLKNASPETAFAVRREGRAVIVEPASLPASVPLPSGERLNALLVYARSAAQPVGLPHDATRRESIYED